MILIPFFEIPHRDRLAKYVKSRCVQIIPRSTGKIRFRFGQNLYIMAPLSVYGKTAPSVSVILKLWTVWIAQTLNYAT